LRNVPTTNTQCITSHYSIIELGSTLYNLFWEGKKERRKKEKKKQTNKQFYAIKI
jgi:hypothetical protein